MARFIDPNNLQLRFVDPNDIEWKHITGQVGNLKEGERQKLAEQRRIRYLDNNSPVGIAFKALKRRRDLEEKIKYYKPLVEKIDSFLDTQREIFNNKKNFNEIKISQDNKMLEIFDKIFEKRKHFKDGQMIWYEIVIGNRWNYRLTATEDRYHEKTVLSIWCYQYSEESQCRMWETIYSQSFPTDIIKK